MERPGHAAEPRAGDNAVPLEPGVLLAGLYRLVRRLGAGGMGEVWEAQHERTKGRVAVKLLLPEMGRRAEMLQRFQREVEVTSALNHPNIVRVGDADRLPDGRPFLVMEFLEGYDLASVAQAGRPLDPRQAVEIIDQVATGLQAAHDRSIIHRDLKPANIFIVPIAGGERPLVKLLDFGISKVRDGGGTLTQPQAIIGTPQYMAPEQAAVGASSLDGRADQFSLAAIAYELFTGRVAFAGDGLANTIQKILAEAPPSFAVQGVCLPARVEEVILRGLQKRPEDRFASVMAFSNALKQAADVQPNRPPSQEAVFSRTMLLPTQDPPPTTLRSSAGQVQGPRSVRASLSIPGTASSRRRMVGVAVGAAGLLCALLVVASLGRRTAVLPGPGTVQTPAAGTTGTAMPATQPAPEPSPPAALDRPVFDKSVGSPGTELEFAL